MSTPDLAIVIGAMKAGTTTLFERLGTHPRVTPSQPKEPGFFCRDDRWAKGGDWYRERWPEDLDGRVRLEASTGYTMRPRFPATFRRMRSYLDERGLRARFVYSLRDPLERIRSHLTHWLAGGQETKLFHARRGSMDGHVLGISMYARQLGAFLEHFDRSEIHIVRFERLADDTAATLREVASTLGLDPEGLDEGEDVHNPSAGKYRKSPAWAALETAGLDRFTDALPEPVLARLRDVLGSPIESKIELNQAQRRSYLRALAADLERLRDVHGVDVRGWQLPAELEDGEDAAPAP